MKIGSRAILRREPCQVLTEAAVSVSWMCCGFAQSEWHGFFKGFHPLTHSGISSHALSPWVTPRNRRAATRIKLRRLFYFQ